MKHTSFFNFTVAIIFGLTAYIAFLPAIEAYRIKVIGHIPKLNYCKVLITDNNGKLLNGTDDWKLCNNGVQTPCVLIDTQLTATSFAITEVWGNQTRSTHGGFDKDTCISINGTTNDWTYSEDGYLRSVSICAKVTAPCA